MTGQGTLEAGQLRTERVSLEARSSDPSSPADGAVWLRTDLTGTDKYGELRWFDGSTTNSAPVFALGTSSSSVEEIVRVETPSGIGYVPFTAPTDAAHPPVTLQHNGSQLGLHNAQQTIQPTLTVDATLNAGSLDVFVEQDGDQDGTFETSETVSVTSSGGQTTTLSSVDTSGGDYRVTPQFSVSSVTDDAALVRSISLFDTLLWDSDDWDSATGESGTMHESVANTDYDTADLQQAVPVGSTDANITNGLVAHYLLQEDSGGTAFDFAGSNDGTVNGATQGATGLLGTSAYDFDGVDDKVNCGSVWGSGSVYAGAFWFNPSSTGVNHLLDQNGLLTIFYDRKGDKSLEIGVYGGSFNHGATLPTNQWHHCAFYYDPSSELKIWANANAKSASTFESVDTASNDLLIGVGTGGVGSTNLKGHTDGRIADVRIYNQALSQSSVQYLYQSVVGEAQLVTETQTI